MVCLRGSQGYETEDETPGHTKPKAKQSLVWLYELFEGDLVFERDRDILRPTGGSSRLSQILHPPMDPPSGYYRLLPRLSRLPSFSLEALPFTIEELDQAGLWGEGESISHVARPSHTYHPPCRCFRPRRTDIENDGGAPRTPRRVPWLLSASVPHLPLRI